MTTPPPGTYQAVCPHGQIVTWHMRCPGSWPDCPAEHDQPTPPPAPQPARPTLPRQVRAWAHQLLRRTK